MGEDNGVSPLRIIIAAASGAAAAVHFGMIPSHAGSSTAQAVGFGIAAWVGVIFAIAVIFRPSAKLLLAGAAAHLGMIAIWIVSRTAGLPVGAHAGQSESVGSVDVFATVAEGVVVLGALSLVRAREHRGPTGPVWQTVSGFVGALALVGATATLVSPSARDHATAAHSDHETVAADDATVAAGDDHHAVAADGSTVVADGAQTLAAADNSTTDAAPPAADHHGTTTVAAVPASELAQRCDLGLNTVAFWEETHVVNGGAAQPFDGSADLDELIRLATQPGGAESRDAQMVRKLGEVSDETYDSFINWLPTFAATAHTASAAAPDDNGGHGGHLGPQAWTAMTDQAECDQLASELARTKAVAMKYPTAADAVAGGWRRVTGYVPGIAAHYMNFGYVDGEFNIDEPEMLLYDGDDANASMVGVSYYMIHDSDFEPTQGFTGPNDHFHRHVGLCVAPGAGVVGDSATTAEECAARGGVKSGGTGGWMNHVWVVPGCESPWGLFSGASPTLEGSLTQASGTDGGGCAGSEVLDRYDLTQGTPDNVPPALVGESAAATSS